QLDDVIARIRSLRVGLALKPTGDNPRASLGDLLSGSLPNAEQQQTFADIFVHHDGTEDELWKAVAETGQFSAEEVKKIQTTIGLGSLTDNYLPLVRKLQSMSQTD